MACGAAVIIQRLFEQGVIHGMVSLGGSAGTTIATAAMRALPMGFPKVMVSTLASGDTRPYIGTIDICMMYSVVDIAGLKRGFTANIEQCRSGDLWNGHLPRRMLCPVKDRQLLRPCSVLQRPA